MFGWTYLDENGEDVGTSHHFDDRDAAEDWMGQSWPSLAEFGVEQVVLCDRRSGASVYRMGLSAE
jgi:hypothetical protein